MKLSSPKELKGTGWDTLTFWKSGEYQVIKERLDAYDQKTAHSSGPLALDFQYNPVRGDLYRALTLVPFDRVSVAVLGQDPYPQRMYCTGVAFSTPPGVTRLPGTLINIFKELEDDLQYPPPKSGDLTQWVNQGVLLWNVYPTCAVGHPGSHHWVEWELLTQEILEKLDARERPIVAVCLGKCARSFVRCIRHGRVLETSHPSPLGVQYGFLGSKIFSHTNGLLRELGQPEINWKL